MVNITTESVVFFGAGPVAASSLDFLANNFSVEAVITKPRPDHFRGEVPVIEIANKHNLSIIEVSSKTELTDKLSHAGLTSRTGVLIDFGIIIEQSVIDFFPLGIINSHFSLLPEWRGADPISFAILSGQPTTGVSLMLVNARMDEGDLLATSEFSMPPDITINQLTDNLIDISNAMLQTVLPLHIDGVIQPITQTNIQQTPTYSRKLTKQDGQIDWQKRAVDIEREIRAFLTWPKSYTNLKDINVVITKARVAHDDAAPDIKKPGTLYLPANKKELFVRCGDGFLAIEQIKPAGKPAMSIAQFLAGYRQKLLNS